MLSNCVRVSRGTVSAQALARFYATSQAHQGHQFASLSKSRNMLSAVADHFFLNQKRSFAGSAVKKGFVQVALKSFREYGIVPDVVDRAPTEVLSACYGELQLKEGNILTPTEVKDPPTLSWNADGNCFYTVCMIDPDAPSRKDPKFREWQHWLVVNVPGCKILNGDVLSEYIGSGPPKDTGLHRYVFLVYRQPSKLEFKEKRLKNNSGAGRGGFKIAKFAQKYKLGVPIAGNFFQAEWDDYVPKLYAKLEGKK